MQHRTSGQFLDPDMQSRRKKRQIRNWIILIVMIAAMVAGISFLRGLGKTTEIAPMRLNCYSTQDVTVFGEKILYYDDLSLHCLSASGAHLWSFPVGSGATYSAADGHIAIWSGNQLFIVDGNGRATFNESLSSPVLFARVGPSYVAVVTGSNTASEMIVLDMQGAQIDRESTAFKNMVVLDAGFYGPQGAYMWTLSLDAFSTSINTVMHTFQVGKKNTGNTSLGEYLTYKVLFENEKLRVFTTQQMYTYDYRAVQNTNATVLIYGWQLVDWFLPERGDASMLLCPVSQIAGSSGVSDLRILRGNADIRCSLPDACMGAAIRGQYVYAVSDQYLYRVNVSNRVCTPFSLNLPDHLTCTGFVGLTDNGRAVISCGDEVYILQLPQ